MKNFKKQIKIFLLLLFVSPTILFAQWNTKKQEIYAYVGAGANSFTPQWADITNFGKGYNDFYGAQLSKQFSGFTHKIAANVEAGIVIGNSIDIGLRFQMPTAYYNSATFTNGESREFKFVPVMNELNMGFNAFHIGKLFIGANFGAVFSKGQLFSGYQYNNDFVSYGTEKRLNGIFELKKSLFTAGLQAYFVPHENVAITFQWQRVGVLKNMVKSTITAASGELRDNLDGVGTFYSNHSYTTYLAKDFESAGNANTYFVGLNNTANADYGGDRFLLTARFNLLLLDPSNH
jgi:hypothetical protein